MRAPENTVWDGWPYLVVLLICFFVGVLGGLLLAVLGKPSAELRSYLNDYFDLAAHGELTVSFLSLLWDCFRWPLAVAAFALTSLGVGVIPALLLIRGLFLSYATASFSVLLGAEGTAAAAALFGVTALLELPALFLIGSECFRTACKRLSGSVPDADGRLRLAVLLPGIGILILAVALQWTVTPALLSAVCARLFA